MELDKEKLTKLVLDKTTLKKEDVEKVFENAKEWVESRGIPKNKQTEYILRRAYASFKKRLLSPALKFNGIVLGDMGITDFGAARKQREIIEKFEKSDEKGRQEMIDKHLINEKGEPLYDKGFRKGEVIKPEENKTRNLLVYCRKDKDVGKYKLGTLRLNNNITMNVPLLKPVEFLANLSDKSTEEMMQLNESDVTEFNVLKDEAEKFDFESFVEKNFSAYMIKYKESLLKHHAENENNYDRFCIIKGDVIRVRKTANSLLVVLSLPSSSKLSDDSTEDVIDIWLNRPYEVDEMMMDVYVIGRTNLNIRDNKEVITLSGYALYSAYDVVEPEEIVE